MHVFESRQRQDHEEPLFDVLLRLVKTTPPASESDLRSKVTKLMRDRNIRKCTSDTQLKFKNDGNSDLYRSLAIGRSNGDQVLQALVREIITVNNMRLNKERVAHSLIVILSTLVEYATPVERKIIIDAITDSLNVPVSAAFITRICQFYQEVNQLGDIDSHIIQRAQNAADKAEITVAIIDGLTSQSTEQLALERLARRKAREAAAKPKLTSVPIIEILKMMLNYAGDLAKQNESYRTHAVDYSAFIVALTQHQPGVSSVQPHTATEKKNDNENSELKKKAKLWMERIEYKR